MYSVTFSYLIPSRSELTLQRAMLFEQLLVFILQGLEACRKLPHQIVRVHACHRLLFFPVYNVPAM